MPRFDVYVDTADQNETLLLDVQADVLDELDTRVVVPLLPLDRAPKAARTLNPTFRIRGESYVMMTQYIAAVPIGHLRTPLASLDADHQQITLALDLLLTGF